MSDTGHISFRFSENTIHQGVKQVHDLPRGEGSCLVFLSVIYTHTHTYLKNKQSSRKSEVLPGFLCPDSWRILNKIAPSQHDDIALFLNWARDVQVRSLVVVFLGCYLLPVLFPFISPPFALPRPLTPCDFVDF